MNVGKRAFLYLTRKKGKNLLLGIVFLLISFSLLTGSVVYLGIRQVSEDLRSDIGASFNIRPYEQFDVNNGQVSSKGTPVMDEQSIRRVISIVGKELKCYNTEHSGYVKGENLSFLAGTGHSEESNMGTVKAVRDSSLCQAFLDEEYELAEGKHIKSEDNGKILISKALAEQNNLAVGDKITLTHAKLGSDNGVYTDLMKEKSAYETVEIKGIYDIKNASDNALNPTAKKAENLIFSDSQLLISLQEQEQGVYEGEISFFIADPLYLDKMVSEIKGIDSIAWNNHVINTNDFKYSKIAEQFQSMQKVVVALLAVAAVLGFLVLMLILTFRIRGRMQEAGILLAVGKSKQQIIGQFLIEAMILLWIGFLLAIIIFLPLADTLNSLLFDFITQSTIHKNYLQPDFLHFVILLILENLGVLLTVLVCSGVILSLKPKEILTKMS
ncbi:MAG: ABC transporter permease [Lachnospiraceae bacterium]|nr:ABC transporter permease [Lachnospiraceae bacterium]